MEAERHDEEFMKRPAMLKTRKPDPNAGEESKETKIRPSQRQTKPFSPQKHSPKKMTTTKAIGTQ